MGIHTDVCTVGNFGSSDRLDYTVLGNGVNLASRLESMAEANQILISENTHNLINEDIESQFFSEITAKGRAHPVKAYQVSGIVPKKIKEEVIEASEEGFELRLDRKMVKNKHEVLSILEETIERLTS
jgi:class 3 adenylate cyclase